MADPLEVNEIAEELMMILMNDKMSGQLLPEFGTNCLTELHNNIGALATHNWQRGTFEKAYEVDGHAINQHYLLKARACFYCPCRCDRYTAITKGEYAGTYTGGPEYLTVSFFWKQVRE